MQAKYNFIELSQKEKLKFFSQEVFEGFQSFRKIIIVLLLGVAGVDFILKQFIFPCVEEKDTYPSSILNIWTTVSAIVLYSLTLLRFLQKNRLWADRIRYSLYCATSILYSINFYNNVLHFLSTAIQSKSPDDWTLCIILISNSGYTAVLVYLIIPNWYFKLLMIGSPYLAIIVGFVTMNGHMKRWAIVKSIANILYVIAFLIVTNHLRWKSFLKTSESEAWNHIYNSILDRTPGSIAVMDTKGSIIYSNQSFKNYAGADVGRFLKSIHKLKLREDPTNHVAVDVHPPSNELEPYENWAKNNIGSRKGSQFIGRKLTDHVLPTTYQTLEDLTSHFREQLLKYNVQTEAQLQFDAKMPQVSILKDTTVSFEVTINLLFEHKKIILILNNTTQRDFIAKLENNNEYKDKLLASVSHELITPLNGNLGFLQTALNEEEVSTEVKEKLLLPAFRSGKFLSHLINDILDYCKIQTENIQLNLEHKSLKETLEYCYQLLEHAFRLKNLEFTLSIDNTLPTYISTDHNRLIQIILNLLSNALKFTRKGTVVLEAKACIKSDTLEISVSDTGAGMTREDMLRLFEDSVIFREATDEQRIRSKGVGLGLKIANKLAKMLGPDNEEGLQIESTEGAGTIFSFEIVNKKLEEASVLGILKHISDETLSHTSLPEIPLEIVQHDNEVSPRSIKKYRNKQKFQSGFKTHILSPEEKKVLLVDDDQVNILVLQHLLQQSKIQSDTAYNGREALEKVMSQPYAYKLILMDCQMPEIDGYQATRQLVQKMKAGELPWIPVVGCTAFSGKEQLLECIRSGMREVLAKPVLKDKLNDVVAKYMN